MSNTQKDKDREAFQRVKEKSEDDFEKYITYISAGGLGLSLTFIEKVVPFEKSIALWTLIFAWALLILTLLINLSSHFYSKKLLDKTIDDIDNDVPDLIDKINRRNKKIDNVNIGTIISLIIGIVFLVSFVSLNAYNMAKQKKVPQENTQQKPLQQDYEKLGRTIPKPNTENSQSDSSSSNNNSTKK